MHGNGISTDTPFREFASDKGGGRPENYGYLGDREQVVLERLIDFLRTTEIRNLGFFLGEHHAALGGKNFGHCLLMKYLIFGGPGEVPNVEIILPSTKMLGSAFYFTFLAHNRELQTLLRAKYDAKGYAKADYLEVQEAFQRALMPRVIKEELLVLLQKAQHEFYILRSSGSCEDGKLPSAGLFDSLVYFDDRQGRSLHQRLKVFESVLKQVWASLFSPPAISMMLRCGLNPLCESMSITFQPVIGDWFGPYYFPLISGVVKSTNTWPWGPEISREDPVGRVGLGMGTFMVGESGSYPEGGPRVISFPQDGSLVQMVGDYLDPETTYATGGKPIARNDAPDNGQTKMDVLMVEDGIGVLRTVDLYFDPRRRDNDQGPAAHIPPIHRRYMASLRRVTDWTSGQAAMVELYDALDLPLQIRRGDFFDLGKLVRRVMDDLLSETRQTVSMEFAVRPVVKEGVDDQGRPSSRVTFEFHLLQVRPQAAHSADQPTPLTPLEPGVHVLLASTHAAFGHLETTLGQAVFLSNELMEYLGKARVQAFLRELDRTHRSAYLLVGPDAEEFVVGSSGFESLYSGLSPRAVISTKTRLGIRSLAGYSGSHAADNIERAPVIIQEAGCLEPALEARLEEMLARVKHLGDQVRAVDLCLAGQYRVELDGLSGRGQVFLQEG